jgi:hypothetical protein
MSEEQKEVIVTERDKAVKAAAEKNAALGDKVGPRWKVGSTKGKNPVIITYENLDDSKPESLPKTVQEFTEVITSDNKVLLDYLIRGYNDAMFEAASDPLSEYVSAVWAPEVAVTFRTAVRNYAKGLGLELEEAVAIIRPGFAAKFGA